MWILYTHSLTIGLMFVYMYVFRLSSTVVFVPSHRDVHHDFVYPQPPFSTKVNLGELPEVSYCK